MRTSLGEPKYGASVNNTVHKPWRNYYQPDPAPSLDAAPMEDDNKRKAMDNRPSWMDKRTKVQFPTDKSTKPASFVVNAACYNTCTGTRARPMPIDIDNGLPAVAMRFGDTDEGEVAFRVSIDSCAGLNIGNLKIHQWVATTYPHIVKKWVEFDDKDQFEPLALNCALKDLDNKDSTTGKLTALVTYLTRYTTIDNQPITLSFGLGNEVAVNAIIGKPTLKAWKGCIDFASNTFTSEALRLSFDMEYKMADSGLPKSVVFDSTGFVRPKTSGQIGAFVLSVDRETNSATYDTTLTSDTVTESQIDGCLTRVVKHATSP